MTPVPVPGTLSLTSSFVFSRTSATTTSVFSFPGTRRHSLLVERTHSAPCAAAMGYKGESAGVRMGMGGKLKWTVCCGQTSGGGGMGVPRVQGSSPEGVGEGSKGT